MKYVSFHRTLIFLLSCISKKTFYNFCSDYNMVANYINYRETQQRSKSKLKKKK